MWYDIRKTLSYNKLYNFIVGNRGGGKTFGFKKWAIEDYKKNGNQFVYLRRYKQELKTISKFFDDIIEFFPEDKFEVDGMLLKVNDQVAGTAMCLSTAKIQKSTPFPFVDKLLFDEFIIEKGVYHYLPDEVVSFLELYETVSRLRDVKAFFMSNALTVTNPYFIYFSLNLPYGTLISTKGDLLLQLVQDAEFIKAKKATRFGKIIDGTPYGKYAIDNEFLLDNRCFVAKKTPNARYVFTFMYKDVKYGVYIDATVGLMFVSKDVDPSCRTIYSLTLADHSPNTMLLKGINKRLLFYKFTENFKLGNVRFETIGIKNTIMEVIKLTL